MRIIDCFLDLVKNSVFDYAKIVNKPLQKLSPKDYLWEKDQNYCSTFAVNFLSLRCTFFLKSWKKKGRDFPSTPAAWKPAVFAHWWSSLTWNIGRLSPISTVVIWAETNPWNAPRRSDWVVVARLRLRSKSTRRGSKALSVDGRLCSTEIKDQFQISQWYIFVVYKFSLSSNSFIAKLLHSILRIRLAKAYFIISVKDISLAQR